MVYRCSLGREELRAREDHALGKTAATLPATAFPLHQGLVIEGPPTVIATFG